jgi:anti-sigma B factor antagonist
MELVHENRPDGVTVVRPAGRIDLLSSEGLRQQFRDMIADGQRFLIVDLSEVTFIDSSGLGALIGGLKAARLAGGDLRIARPAEQARVILELTTLNRVLRPYTSVEEALATFDRSAA